jgi:hypothetical protein
MKYITHKFHSENTVTAGPTDRAVLDVSATGFVGLNPDRGMDVSVFFCVMPCCIGKGLVNGRSPVQGVLPQYLKDS